MASLESKLRTAAAAYGPLAALLASGSPALFRWYDTTLVQGAVYPAIVARVVSNSSSYVGTGRLPTSFARVQFTVWGGQYAAGVAAADAVRDALVAFFQQLNLVGIPNQVMYSNVILNEMRGVFVPTDTPVFQRIIDVNIFSDETK
jgi:hypothetical protein